MANLTAVSSGISDLLQTFSGSAAGALPTLLSSTNVQASLQKASSGDIVDLSEQAVSLQQVTGLLGDASSLSGNATVPTATSGASAAAGSLPTESFAQSEASALLGTGNSTVSYLG